MMTLDQVVAQVSPRYSYSICTAIRRMLQKNPSDRPNASLLLQTFQNLQRALLSPISSLSPFLPTLVNMAASPMASNVAQPVPVLPTHRVKSTNSTITPTPLQIPLLNPDYFVSEGKIDRVEKQEKVQYLQEIPFLAQQDIHKSEPPAAGCDADEPPSSLEHPH